MHKLIFQTIEEWLGGGRKYLSGFDYSIADLHLYNEVLNLTAITGEEINKKNYPNMEKWMSLVDNISSVRVGAKRFMEEINAIKEC